MASHSADHRSSSKSKYEIDDGRHFRNANPDYHSESEEITDGQISAAATEKIKSALRNMTNYISQNMESLDVTDESVYTGISGNAYMYWYRALKEKDVKKRDDFLKNAITLVRRAIDCPKSRHVTFLCGDSGPIVTGLLCGARTDVTREAQIQELLDLKSIAVNPRTPDEVLYGRAGYLYSLLIARKMGVMQDKIDQTIVEVVNIMFRSGLSTSSKLKMEEKLKPPLMYKWHDTYYLGAAHGVAGILYIIMHVSPELMEYDALKKYVKPCVDWMMNLKFPSGNYPSSWNKERDKLIHWCHGSPGWIYMFLRAYEIFKDEIYLERAKECGEVIWARGLLQKGYGICHGVAGNGYAFLALYRATGELQHLHRAAKFADFCTDYGQHGCGSPDRPLSMFEGLAGTICFLQDMLDPKESRFPCFEL